MLVKNMSATKQPIVIANWKMKLSVKQSLQLAKSYRRAAAWGHKVDIVVCPSALVLSAVKEIFGRKHLALGLQDSSAAASGAYTGQISPAHGRELGAEYVILGHSEVRATGQNDELIGAKVAAALKAGLTPIVCLGESLDQRGQNLADQVVERQFDGIFKNIDLSGGEIVMAYEPSWTISDAGSRPALPSEIDHSCRLIEELVIDRFGQNAFDRQVRIVYGGTVNVGNIDHFMTLENVDGFLVGSDSLNDVNWLELVKKISTK